MTTSRAQSLGEEIANSITHGLGAAASAAGAVLLLARAAASGDAWRILADAVFVGTLFLLYLASTLYHAIPARRARPVLQVLDHSAIYLLIAGTYTPFMLLNLRGGWGWTLLGVVWGLAAAGIVFKALFRDRYLAVSTAVYVAMGWMVLLAGARLVATVAPHGLAWLVGGGVLYTAGVVFFAWERQRYAHAVWHGFVLAGSACHFCSVLWYAAPQAR